MISPYIKITLFACITCLLPACGPPKTATQPQPAVVSERTGVPDSQVLTVLLKASRDAGGGVRFEVAERIQSPGRLKEGESRESAPQDGYLLIMTTTAGQVLYQAYIGDPLVRRVEFPDDNRQLTSRDIQLEENIVPIRINARPDISACEIYKVSGTVKTLITQIPMRYDQH